MNEPWENFSPYWLQTAAPSGANGGLLDSLIRPADEPWNDPRPTIFAQTPWGSMTPPLNPFGLAPTFPSAPPPGSWESSSASLWHTPFGANGGLLDSLTRPADEPWNDLRPMKFAQTPWGSMTPPPSLFGLSPTFRSTPPPGSLDSSAPSWLNTASPFGADLKQPAWPDLPAPPGLVMLPWEYPWPHKSPLDMWAESTQPTPSAALSPPFSPAPPLEHLDSGKYWPVTPALSGATAQPPTHWFHFSPVPQAPSWDQVPTYPADGVAPSFSQPPSPESWATPAPPLEYLDSGKYWPAAPAWGGGESATAVPQPSPVTAAGLAKQGSVGLAKGLIGLPGMIGDARDLGFNIGDWISEKIRDRRTLTDQQRLEQAHGADFTPGAAARQKQQRYDEARRNLFATNPFLASAPSSSDIQGVVEQVTGLFRKPENMAEEYADTAGQFLPAIFGGPGGWARRGAQWLGPALTSETSGQLTKGTEWEPAARFAGAIFGGAPAFAHPSAPRGAPTPPPPRPAAAGDHLAAPGASERSAPKLNDAGPRGYAPQEAVPGEITEHLSGTRNQPYDWRQAYSGSGWINPKTGRDAIAEAMHLAPRSPTLPATGSYRAHSGNWETNPAHTGRWTPELAPDGLDLSPRSKSLIKAAERTRAVLDGQEYGAYHVRIPNAPEASRTSVNIPHSGPLDPTKAEWLGPLADRHGFYMSDRGNGVSLIAKRPADGGPQSKADTAGLLRGELGQGIHDRLPGAVPTPTRFVSDIVEGIGRPPGKGQATKAWLDTLDRAPPEAIEGLGRSGLVRDIIAGLHARDARLHGTTGPGGDLGTAQKELQHLRDAATRNRPENWLAAVREAFRANPEAFPAVLLPLVAGAGAYDFAGPRE